MKFRLDRTEPEPSFRRQRRTEPNPNQVLNNEAEPNRTELEPIKVGSIRALVTIQHTTKLYW